jgi:hypothetical protein
MPHGALIQARQAVTLARYLPRWEQNLLALGLVGAGGALLWFGDLAGLVPMAGAGLFVVTRIRQRRRERRPSAP